MCGCSHTECCRIHALLAGHTVEHSFTTAQKHVNESECCCVHDHRPGCAHARHSNHATGTCCCQGTLSEPVRLPHKVHTSFKLLGTGLRDVAVFEGIPAGKPIVADGEPPPNNLPCVHRRHSPHHKAMLAANAVTCVCALYTPATRPSFHQQL